MLRSFPVSRWSLEEHRQECESGSPSGILSALFAAFFSILNKFFVQDADAITVTGLEMVVGAAGLAFVSPHIWPTRHDAVLILVLAVGCTLVPYVLSLVALRHLSAFSAALAVNMEPVYAIILAILLLGEQRELTLAFYAGVAIIMGGRFQPPAIEYRSGVNSRNSVAILIRFPRL